MALSLILTCHLYKRAVLNRTHRRWIVHSSENRSVSYTVLLHKRIASILACSSEPVGCYSQVMASTFALVSPSRDMTTTL